MTPQEFAYWLQGFAELNAQPPTAEQWQSIRDHLALVFTKVTPNRIAPPSEPLFVPPIDWKPNPWPGEPYRVTCAVAGGTAATTYC